MEAPPHAACLDRETLDFLFPCHFQVDEGMKVKSVGPGLARLMPDLALGAPVTGAFRLETPRGQLELSSLLGRQVVLAAQGDARLRFRGAVAPQSDGCLFLVSPVLSDGEAAKRLGVNLGALSPCDGSAELVIANEMQRLLTCEAKTLAAGLTATRDAAVAKEAFFDTILQLLPAAVMVKDARDGRYILVNEGAEEVLGIPAGDMLGKCVFDLFPLDEATKFAAEDAEVIRSGELKIEQEEAITTRSRGLRYHITRKLATYDADGARYIVTMGEDVTERHEAEVALRQALVVAEQANVSKSAFLANMSHEIRTPLNGIVAVADVLSRADIPARERDLVGIIQSSGGTLERLLSDILDLARIESHQISIETAPFHLGEMARATVMLAKLRADEKGVGLTCDLDHDVDRFVIGDMIRVRQVLANLLSNAVKFTDGGGVRLRIRRTRRDSVRFEVEDSGVGFDAAARERIFARFQQADDTITRRFGGSGLGLAISRELVGLMGGELQCESTVGKGSTFWFEAPLPPCDGVQDRRPPQEVAEAGATRPRILLADDHPTNRKVVELMLEEQADLICVENGLEAVEAFAAAEFDLILMDMQMPVMDGLTAVREIRKREPTGRRIPIIMLTANALPEHVAATAAAGADLHLHKPITAASLFAAITQVSHDHGSDVAQASAP